jgi:hypothetical protein
VKKLISIVVALVMVCAMGFAVMADDATSSPTASSKVSGTTDQAGVTVHVEDVSLTESQTTALKTLVGDKTTEAVSVYLTDDTGAVVQPSAPVAFTLDNASNVTNVYVWNNETSAWDSATFELKDGKVVVTFPHLSPVAFAFRGETASNSTTTTSNSTAAAGTDSTKSSAQTGYNSLIYIVAAIALASGAVFFFSSAKKQSVAKEVQM